ncbi:hypothetical protein [Lactococcus garvieae]|uniref:hypothetical protein n=1 Tax=Lactococcus garvieae TaxID=1363 RepID=UPI0002DAD044|nr:hypothetical protein [Lactococcus garvieae]
MGNIKKHSEMVTNKLKIAYYKNKETIGLGIFAISLIGNIVQAKQNKDIQSPSETGKRLRSFRNK